MFNDLSELPFLGKDQVWIPTYNNVRLFSGFESVWRGIVDSNAAGRGDPKHKNSLIVQGIKSVTSSPLGLNALGKEFFDLLDALISLSPDQIVNQGLDFGALLGLGIFSGGRIFGLSAANSLSVGLNVQPIGLGFSFSASTSGGLLLPSYTYVNSFGTQGVIAKQASKSGYIFSQFLNKSFDESDSRSEVVAGHSNRIVERQAVEGTDRQRVKGAEVMWQGELVDIITGAIPLNLTLPATAGKMHFRTSDDSLRVRFGSGVGKSLFVDFWFDLTEEMVKDDY